MIDNKKKALFKYIENYDWYFTNIHFVYFAIILLVLLTFENYSSCWITLSLGVHVPARGKYRPPPLKLSLNDVKLEMI